MDNYDVVIERTVRDLFKSSPLPQIKKYKTNKEKEIMKKDEELRNLILEKYPLLIKSISSLEGINSSLNDLQEIRKKFVENVDLMEQNLKNENVYKFNQNLFSGSLDNNSDEEEEIDDIEYIQETISENLDQCWKIVNYSSEKEFDNLLISLIGLKRKLNKLNEYEKNNKNNFNYSLADDSKFLFENYDFIMIQFIENLIQNFLQIDVLQNSSYLHNYFINFFSVFYLINSNKKLDLSEYKKIISDRNINTFYDEIFNLNFDITKNDKNSKLYISLYKSIELLIKLNLVKLSKNFNSISNISSKEADIHSTLVRNIVEIYSNSYMIILFINKLKFNTLASLEDGLESESIYTNLSNGPSSDEEELGMGESEQYFNLKNILMKINTIFSLDSNNRDLENNNIFDVFKIFNKIDTNIINRKFIDFIKIEISKNFKILNDNNFSQNLISFWQSAFKTIISNQYYDKDFINKVLGQGNNEEDVHEFLFFNLLFSEKYLEQLGYFLSEGFKKISFEKFLQTGNGSSQKEEVILNLFKEIQYASFEGNKILKNQMIKILQTQTLNYLVNSEKLVLENLKKNEKLSQTSSFVTFLVNFFWNKKTKFFLTEFNFKDCLDVLIKFVEIFYQSILKDVQVYLQDIRELLVLENFSDENSYNRTNKDESDQNRFTDSLTELSNYLKNNFNFENLEIESEKYSESKIKDKILEIIIKNYYEEIKNLNSSPEGVINKRILCDIALFGKIYYKIKSEESVEDEIVQKFNEINNIYEIEQIEEYHDIYCFFIKINDEHNKNKEMPSFYFNLQLDSLNQIIPTLSKELLPFHPRLNVFMLSKNEIKPQKSKQPNYINSNSTSKLLELRIDENYLSLRPTSNKSSDVSVQRQDGEAQSQNPQHFSKANLSSNKESSSNSVNSNSQTQQPNIKEYLGFFGGMLKENIKNMAKNYIDNEKLGEKK
jgi:hypothetical protein